MAKALKVVGKVASVAAVVLAFIPGGQPFAAAASAISAVANAGAALLHQPEPQGGAVSKVLIDTSAPSPYVIGRTMTGGVLIHDAGYGADYKKIKNPNRSMVFVYSECGPVNAIEGLYTDGAFAVTQGAVSGYYSGSMHFDKQLGARPEFSALAGNQGSVPRWGTSYKLSGKAAGMVTMRWDKKMLRFSAGAPELNVVIQGVKVYDPRLDSTYPGGVGTCRIDNEATFVYSENPALHSLTYIYGRYDQGVRIFGVGKSFASVDLGAFVDWANVCDANNWKVGGIIYEPADKWNNLKLMMQAGSARPVHNNGLLSVMFDSPKVPVATFTEEDLANGDVTIPATQSFRDRINGIVPRYRSSAHNWEYVAGSAVSIAAYVTADGEDKRREIQYTLCQSQTQAAQLAGYEIVNARELRDITLPFKPSVLPYGSGEAIELNMPNLGLVGTFVIQSKRFDPLSAITTVTLQSETATKHPFALGATTTAPEVPSLTVGEDLDRATFSAGGGEDLLETMIATSWTKSLVITASGSGSISLSNHSRVYSDETVSVLGDTLVGLSLDTRYSIYYDDDGRDGGAVTYTATTAHEEAQTSETTPSRHFIGYVKTPASIGSSDVSGVSVLPPTLVPETVPNSSNLGGRPAAEINADIQSALSGVSNINDSVVPALQASITSTNDVAVDARNKAETAQGEVDAAELLIGVNQSRLNLVEPIAASNASSVVSLTQAQGDQALLITGLTAETQVRQNLVPNPSGELGLSNGWDSAATFTYTAQNPARGWIRSRAFTGGSPSNAQSFTKLIPCFANNHYTLSLRAFCHGLESGSILADIAFYDASGTFITNGVSIIIDNSAGDNRLITTAQAPANAVDMRVVFTTNNIVGNSSYAEWGVYQIKLEYGGTATIFTNDENFNNLGNRITTAESDLITVQQVQGTQALNLTQLTTRADGIDVSLLTQEQTNLTQASNLSALRIEAERGDFASGGANLVVNSDLKNGLEGWRHGWDGTSGFPIIREISPSAWSGMQDVYVARISGGSPALNSPIDGLEQDFDLLIPVKSGERFYLSVDVSIARMFHAAVEAVSYNSTYQYVREDIVGVGGQLSDPHNGDPASFDRVGGFFTVPAGQAIKFIGVRVRGICTGGADPHLWSTNYFMSRVGGAQVIIPPYSAGRSNPIADKTSLSAEFIAEQTARISGDAALTASLALQITRVDNNETSILNEANTRTSETAALGTRSLLLEATVDTPGTGLSSRMVSQEAATADLVANKATVSALNALELRGTSGDFGSGGSNLAVNSSLKNSLFGWEAGLNGNSGLTPIREYNNSTWSGLQNTYTVRFSGTPAAGTVVDALQTPSEHRIPVKSGDRFYVSADVALARMSSAQVLILYYDASGTNIVVNASPSGGSITDATNGDPTYFDRVGGFITVPNNSNIKHMGILVRGHNDGGADPHIWTTNYFIARVGTSQVVPPAYSEGLSDLLADKTETSAAFINEQALRISGDASLSTTLQSLESKTLTRKRPNLIRNPNGEMGLADNWDNTSFLNNAYEHPNWGWWRSRNFTGQSFGFIQDFTELVPVVSGNTYTLSLKTFGVGFDSGNAQVQLAFYNATSFVGSAPFITIDNSSINDVTVSTTGTAPAGAIYARIVLNINSPVGNATYAELGLWEIKLEQGAFATPFSNDRSPALLNANVTALAQTVSDNNLARANEISVVSASLQSQTGSVIPDPEFRDSSFWNFPSGVVAADLDGGWTSRRGLVFNAGSYDFYSNYFPVEPGASYKIKARIWNNSGAGFSGAFYPLIHVPYVAWYSLKHDAYVNPELIDANNGIIAQGDTLDLEWVYTNPTGVTDNANRQWQFRFKGNWTGSSVQMSFSIERLPHKAEVTQNTTAIVTQREFSAAGYQVRVGTDGTPAELAILSETTGAVTTTAFGVKADKILLASGDTAFVIHEDGIDVNSWIRKYEDVPNPDAMVVDGQSFGANSDLLWWAGPFGHPDTCTHENGIRAIKKDGTSWLGGSQEGLTVKSASDTDENTALLENQSSNGNDVNVSCNGSASFTQTVQDANAGAPWPAPATPTMTLELERSVDGGTTWVSVKTQSFTGSSSSSTVQGPAWPEIQNYVHKRTWSISGVMTFLEDASVNGRTDSTVYEWRLTRSAESWSPAEDIKSLTVSFLEGA